MAEETFASKIKSSIPILREAGLDICPLNDTATGPGILFFNKLNPQLCDLLREVSHSGFERVLAVAVSPSWFSDDNAWNLLKAGASDVISYKQMVELPALVSARFNHWRSIDLIINSPLIKQNIIGNSPVWVPVLRRIVEVAQFTDASVLLEGETGTGKELLARLIHDLDPRPEKGEMIVLDCTTIVPELSGSEFFGHERGAFTGAVNARHGAFAMANGGTLFLDEVGELPLTLQAQLLRVIQEGSYKRVGGNSWQQTKFRLVSATNKYLLNEVRKGGFRRDLYYRITGVTCKVPSLQNRLEDIIPLACHFMKNLVDNNEPPDLDEPIRNYLIKRKYPGNVRELKQLVTRIMYRLVGPGPVTIGHIPEDEWPDDRLNLTEWRDATFEENVRRAVNLGIGLKEISNTAIETAIRIAVAVEEGNLQRAAQRLGVTARALQIRRASRRGRDQNPKHHATKSGTNPS